MTALLDYHLEGQISVSADSMVFRGRRVTDGLKVVVKRLRDEHPGPRALARLKHEYSILSSLAIPEVARPLGLVPDGNGQALILEDRGGEPVDAFAARSHFATVDFLRLAIAVSRAVQAFHRKGVIHKDLKPQHILRDPSGTVTIIDFGISTQLARERCEAQEPGRLEGTLAYLAPEQTGRLSGAVDRRSDLYSLGVVFYQLATGQLPFRASDPLELVHSHIAKTAPRADAVRPSVSPMVASIIEKLMAKAADDRYQCAAGLAADLAQCLEELETKGTIEPFVLGSRDLGETLRIPQALYGRVAATDQLRAALTEARSGLSQLVLLSGPPGIGKSALVHGLREEFVRHGRLVTGKFNRERPYSAIADACRDLVRALLGAPTQRVVDQRQALLAALGANARLLVDLVPELERVIGPQPPPPPLGPIEAQNRFEDAFDRFLGVFLTPGTPLVLFLDDLQWSDAASLRLLRRMLRPADRPLLLLGAVRDSEVTQRHPLSLELVELRRAAIKVTTIRIEPLGPRDVGRLLSDSLSRDEQDVQPLAAVLLEKTRGNPLQLETFLAALARDGLVRPDPSSRRWIWDLAAIGARRVADSVVDLVLEGLRAMPITAQRVLSVAACIGHEFDSATLALLGELEPAERAEGLKAALQEGAVLPLDENYRYLDLDAANERGELNAHFRFVHERVQQGAYELFDAATRQSLHLKLGRLLRRSLGADPTDEQLFSVAQQLNRAAPAIEDRGERDWLAELDVRCAKRAQATGAAPIALEQLDCALSLIGPDGWTRQYPVMCAAYLTKAEGQFLSGRPARALELLDEVGAHAATTLDRVVAGTLRTTVLTTMGQLPEACRNTVATLRALSVELPDPADQAALGQAIGVEFAAIRGLLASRPIGSLKVMPELGDPLKLAELEALAKVIPAAYQSNQKFMVLVVLKGARLCFESGMADLTPFFLAQYALAHQTITGNYVEAHELGELAIDVGRARPSASLLGPAHFINGAFITHWREPLAKSLEHFELGLRQCLELGDVRHAAYCSAIGLLYRLLAGVPLEEIRLALKPAFQLIDQFDDVVNRGFLVVTERVIAGLTEEGRALGDLDGRGFDEIEFQRVMPPIVVETYLRLRGVVRSLAGRHSEAIADFSAASPGLGLLSTVERAFFQGLSHAALARASEGALRDANRSALARSIEQLRVWAELCPSNHAHRLALLRAEEAALEGEVSLAMERYEDAIDTATAQGFGHHVALANERCGEFHLAGRRPRVGRTFLLAAVRAYERWGASAKAKHLVAQHPGVELTAGEDDERLNGAAVRRLTTTRRADSATFDLESAMRATQVIASELESERLIDRLLRILVENAGAQRGVLIFPRGEGLFVEAVRTVAPDEVRLGLGMLLDSSVEVPVQLVRYVGRSHETVASGEGVSSVAIEGDRYLAEHAPKSFLCVALMLKGQLSAVVYLENRDAVGVFSPSRVALLEFLATQAATALENSRVYETLERRVLERTEELRVAKEAAEAGTRAKGSFLANMSHEIRTPMNGVLGSAELLLAGELDDDQRKLCETLTASAEALLTILDDILDFSKVEAGQMSLERAPFDPEDLVFGVVELFRARVVGGRVDLLARVDPGLPKRLIGDAGRLRQALANLVGNAIKFTATGRVRIDADAGQSSDGHVELAVRVSDTGIGITTEQLARLFQPFGQADASTSRRFGGTGLGLAISRAYISAMGGSLTVESHAGQGSTFTMSLPLDTAQEQGGRPTARFAGQRALLIDPSDERRTILREQLEHLGFGVVEDEGEAANVEVVLCEQSRWPELKASGRRVLLFPAPTQAAKLGSVRTLRLPARSSELEHVLGVAAPATRTVHRLIASTSAKVLVAEDNHVNQAIARRLLEKLGATVVVVDDGRQAVERVSRERFDVVFMDCQMPETDGFEATRLIREREQREGGHVPIIALTASVMAEERAQAFSAGMDDHLAKPVSAKRLSSAIERWTKAPQRPLDGPPDA